MGRPVVVMVCGGFEPAISTTSSPGNRRGESGEFHHVKNSGWDSGRSLAESNPGIQSKATNPINRLDLISHVHLHVHVLYMYIHTSLFPRLSLLAYAIEYMTFKPLLKKTEGESLVNFIA